jgi:hypothetical protein
MSFVAAAAATRTHLPSARAAAISAANVAANMLNRRPCVVDKKHSSTKLGAIQGDVDLRQVHHVCMRQGCEDASHMGEEMQKGVEVEMLDWE